MKNIEDLIKTSNPKIPDELEPQNIKLTKKRSFRPLAYALYAVAAVALVIGLSHLPQKDIKKNAKTSVKEIVNQSADKPSDTTAGKSDAYHKAYLMFSKNSYVFKNGLKDLSSINYSNAVEDAVPETAINSTTGTASDGTAYSETNTRHENIDEGTRVKTDGKYIYVLDYRNNKIGIHSASNGETSLVSTVELDFTSSEIYVSGDRMIVLGTKYENEQDMYKRKYKTDVNVYDISDRANVSLVGNVTTEGNYYSSRLVNGKLLLFSNVYKYYTEQLAEEDFENYIPSVNGVLVKPEDMIIMPNCEYPDYTLAVTIDVTDASLIDNKAILGSGQLYVTGENIYHISNYYETDQIGEMIDDLLGRYNNRDKEKLQILKVPYSKDGLLGEEIYGKCDGSIKDDYSIDEYNGKLRLVANYYDIDYEVYSALYILDENLEVIGTIKDLAKGEKIKSARFMGDTAYFVTFKNMDPLFSADLSDPSNPKIIGELKIPGFSAYLHPLDDNHLVGIGYEYDENLRFKGVKVSIYDISDKADVKETHKKVFENINTATPINDPNNFMIDTNRKFMGFAVEALFTKQADASFVLKEAGGYMILTYGEEGIELKTIKENVTNKYYDPSYGLYIDDYIYIVEYDGTITSVKISEM